MKFPLSYLTVLSFVFLLFSCELIEENNNLFHSSSKEENKKDQIDWLVFEDDETFQKTIQKVNSLTDEERKNWEKEQNFTSLRGIYETALDEEESYIEKYEKADPKLIEQMIKEGKTHAPYVEKNREYFKFNEDGTFEPNSMTYQLAAVINKNGLVQVGKEIRYYSFYSYKIIADGDASKIEQLMKAKETDVKNFIVVGEIFRYGGDDRTGRIEATCPDDNGDDKVEGDAYAVGSYIYDYYNTYSFRISRIVGAKAVNKNKGIFGNWYKKRTSALRTQCSSVTINDFSGGEYYTTSFDYGTNGQLEKEINNYVHYRQTNQPTSVQPIISASGKVYIYGRGGTNCEDNY